MKNALKLCLVLCVCAMLLSLTACSDTMQFESEAAMMDHLNGMWAIGTDSYYIFCDGQIYTLTTAQFSDAVEALLDTYVEKDRFSELNSMDFEAAVAALNTETLLGQAYEGVLPQPQKGTLLFHEGTSDEFRILVDKEGAVFLELSDSKTRAALLKVSDTLALTQDCFVEAFGNVKEDYTISTASLWTDTNEFAVMVRTFNPDIDGWELVESSEERTVYQSNPYVPSIEGSFLITKNSVFYSQEVTLVNDYVSGFSWNPSLTIDYNPTNGTLHVIDKDNLSLNLYNLFQYAAKAVRKFPGALTHTELYDILLNQPTTLEGNVMRVEKTINGVTYTLTGGTNGYWAELFVRADDEISLSELSQYTNVGTGNANSSNSSQPTTPENEETTAPTETVPVQTAPMNEVPYTTSLAASVPIYSAPDSGSSFVQNVGQDGVYTIVEETYDSNGSLWGKLKSGVGWVMLSEASSTTSRTCPQCGKTEAETVFPDDWEPGMACFGCNYLNFHGGEEAKKYCSQCGADCTFRGLEEDGRCEDCQD